MGTIVRLRNITDVLRDNSLPGMSQEEAIEALTQLVQLEFRFYCIGAGKGGRVMIEPGDESNVVEFLRSRYARPIRERATTTLPGEPQYIEVGPSPETIQEFKDLVTGLQERLAQLEDMHIEETDRVDQLHKAVETINGTYGKLREEVAPELRQRLPQQPILPAQYRWKIVIAGGPAHLIQRLRDNFRNVRFHHIDARQGNMNYQRQSFPAGDLILVLADAIEHQTQASMQKEYGKSNITWAKASLSSLEPLISLWLAERKKEADGA